MAKFTDVANGGLCPGVTKTLIATYIGFVQEFSEKYANTPGLINIPGGAAKWEGHVAEGTTRLDLQGAENGYGNLQAQFGKGHESCKKGGSYGGVLLACGTPFSVADIETALNRSLGSKGTILVRLDVDAQPIQATLPDKTKKTKAGKAAWTPDTVYQ